jgi:hypothetical protein
MGGIGPYFLRAIAAAAIGRWHVQWDHFDRGIAELL